MLVFQENETADTVNGTSGTTRESKHTTQAEFELRDRRHFINETHPEVPAETPTALTPMHVYFQPLRLPPSGNGCNWRTERD